MIIMFQLYFIPPLLTQWFIRLVTLFWWRVFNKLEIHGLENLKEISRPVIFASNHLSDWDGPLIRSVLPMFSRFGPMFYASLPKKYYQGKERGLIRRVLWGGEKFKLVGAYPVYLGLHNLEESLKHHIKILKDGGSICIFPEGKRSNEDNIGEFKIGVAYLAFKSRCPVVPVALTGTKRSGGTKASISFGKPVYYKIDESVSMRSNLSTFSENLRNDVIAMCN